MHAADKVLDEFLLDIVPSSQNGLGVIELSVIRVRSLNEKSSHVLHRVAVRKEAG